MFAFYAIFSNLGNAITFIPVICVYAKENLAFSMCSCDWRDDQIRILQGISGLFLPRINAQHIKSDTY